jgi:cysteine protease ATG4
MYDPLFNPPPQSLHSFDYGLLILIPLRLGLKNVNEDYLPGLRWCLRCPYSVGILGGRPNHAIYFVGYQGAHLFGHDPHTVWPTPALDGPFPSLDYVQQASVSELTSMRISQLDPSIALAFHVKDEAEFDDFIRLAKSAEQGLFTIDHQPPSFDGLHGIDNFAMDDGAAFPGGEEEDEYVFV